MKKLIPLIMILILNSLIFLNINFTQLIIYVNIAYFSIYIIINFKNLQVKNYETNDQVRDFKEEIIEIVEPKEQVVIVKEDDCKVTKEQALALYEKFFYFSNSIPLLEALTKSTQEFETTTLKKVFDQFELIWNESETLIKESEESMESIFDSNKSSNLGYILNSSKDINKDFQNFLPVLESMSKLAEKFVNISMESFNTISKTTKDIEDLAEQVKVISINVRIEAARIQDSGGFKVLGSDITKFADKTSLFAQSTNDKIKNTIGTIDELKNELTGKLKDVSQIANKMYTKIDPFESILETSALSLKSVIGNLNKVSGELNSNLKTSLGNLQFQDITSQEMNHIIDFLKYIELNVTGADQMGELLQKIDKNELKKDILQKLDKISTTGSEAEVISSFGKKWGIKYKDDFHEDFNSVDDGTFLF